MKTFYALFLLGGLSASYAQTIKADRHAPTLYFKLTDSTVVAGKIVGQDSATIVVQQQRGVLTYLQPSQVVRTMTTKPVQPGQASRVTSFSLKDGATVAGQVVRETPIAVVVRQANGTLSYIDPSDIVSTAAVTVVDGTVNRTDDAIAAPYLMSGRTAYTPRSGTVYYRNTYLIRNEAEVGLINGWSIGAVFNPFVRDAYNASQYLSEVNYANTDYGTQFYTRVSLPIGSSIRVGAVFATQLQRVTRFEQQVLVTVTKGALLGQALVTFGKPRNNVTLGYAFRLDDAPLSLQHVGVFTVGAIQYLSPKLALVSDNSIVVKQNVSGPQGTLAQLGAALRIQGNYHAFDLGVSSFVRQNSISYSTPYGGYRTFELTYKAYPYVSYSVQFGGRR